MSLKIQFIRNHVDLQENYVYTYEFFTYHLSKVMTGIYVVNMSYD